MDAAPFHALLIVDVVGSIALTQRLGDHAAADGAKAFRVVLGGA